MKPERPARSSPRIAGCSVQFTVSGEPAGMGYCPIEITIPKLVEMATEQVEHASVSFTALLGREVIEGKQQMVVFAEAPGGLLILDAVEFDEARATGPAHPPEWLLALCNLPSAASPEITIPKLAEMAAEQVELASMPSSPTRIRAGTHLLLFRAARPCASLARRSLRRIRSHWPHPYY
jgi:hypothetical protein